MTQDELFMQRALDLARLGSGSVSPNPLVGCVIVHEGIIIGEGWHRKYGESHAEVMAVESVHDKSLLRKATAFVNLEPCSHYGKTPPCADMLIYHGLKKVVIATLDTHPKVAGNGAKKLRAAGVEVVTGILHDEGKELNKRFFTHVELTRPYIILKWAETSDGFVAQENYVSKWISNEYSRQLVHRWRAEEDAVLVGTRTAQVDNPRLNVRAWSGRNPVRVVIDRFLKLNENLNLFDRSHPTLCYNLIRNEGHKNLTLVRLNEKEFWQEMIHDLYQRDLQSLMVEGGAQTLESFISGDMWDEARIFRSRRSFGKGIAAPVLRGQLVSEQEIMDDHLSIFMNDPSFHK